MPDIALFCEDSFHQKLIGALLARIGAESGVEFRVRYFSARGGLSKMHGEFSDYLRDVSRGHLSMPDSVIVVADANCRGYTARRRLFHDEAERFPALEPIIEYAIPDPHIERWMLLDPVAFRHVFDRGCTLPAIKCAKDEYKNLLRREIRESGIEAPLGGEEFAEEVAAVMDLDRAAIQEASFGLFVRFVRALANRWRVV